MTLGTGSCGLQARFRPLLPWRFGVGRPACVGGLGTPFSKRLRRGFSVDSENDVRHWQLWAAGTIRPSS